MKATYVPGPGAYTVSDALDTKIEKSISMKLKGLLDQMDEKKPGPGAYSATMVPKKMPGGRFGVKPSQSQKNLNNLGPGSYNIPSDFQSVKSKKGTFGNSKRSTIGGANNAPGPGMYDSKPAKPLVSGFGFGSSVRKDPQMPTGKGGTPGPGQYTDKSRGYSAGASIKGRYGSSLDAGKKRVPGPGQYNPDMSITRAETYSSRIGKSNRIDLGANKRTKEWPGPGQFN